MRSCELPGRAALYRGKPLDSQSRCAHWHGPTDIVAFRFACCEGWWPCHACHEETAGHPAVPWPQTRAADPCVLCGPCRREMTSAEYRACGSVCPGCGAAFNPRCEPHWPLYFETPAASNH